MPTIGVAIAIPEPWGSQIQEFRESIDDPMAELIPPHITIVPPIDVAPEFMEAVESHLATTCFAAQPFEVHLHSTGSFRPVSPVVFISVASGIADCEQLQNAVRTGPLGIDLAFPYHPHVTVAHELADDVLDKAASELFGFDATFTVGAVNLYVHHEQAGWLLMQQFKLGQ